MTSWLQDYCEEQTRARMLDKFIRRGKLPSGDPVVFPSVRRYAPSHVEQRPPRVWLIQAGILAAIVIFAALMIAAAYYWAG